MPNAASASPSAAPNTSPTGRPWHVGKEEAWLLGLAGGQDPRMIHWPVPVRAASRTVGVAPAV